MPRDLPAEAKAEWKRVVPVIEEAGLLTTIDRGVLIRYCCAWADWLEVQGLIQPSGKLLKGSRGNLVRNPLWFQLQDAGATLTELGRQLGLSPVARIRAGIKHEVPINQAAEEQRRIAVIEEYAASSRSERRSMTTTTPPTMTIVEAPIDELRPDPANPRRISDAQLEALTRSLKEYGFVQPVLARREDKTVIGGHQRLLAARRLGYRRCR
jgi:P27 family predicted phage terminase small subunit